MTLSILPKKLSPLWLLVLLCIVYLMVMQSGLSAQPLLDDSAITRILGAFNQPISSLQELRALGSSSSSGPTGRPISMLSFAIGHTGKFSYQDQLVTNLIIHTINATLLYILVKLVASQVANTKQRAATLALITSGIWLLHPLHVSTNLYLVQRMTSLSALFALSSLITYSAGRLSIEKHQTKRGFAYLTASVFFGLIGVLSKENAALLPVGFLALEYTILSCRNKLSTTIKFCFAAIPSALIIIYLSNLLIQNHHSSNVGGTSVERLMTQARLMWTYIELTLIPQSLTNGLFYDSIKLSSNIITPVTTLFSCFAIAASIGAAICLRRRAPLIALGIMWFFGFHLLEGTSVPLELFFEHRNYLPSIGIAIIIANCLLFIKTRLNALTAIACIAIIGLLAFTLHLRATLWGKPMEQLLTWADTNPTSVRVWQTLAAKAHENRQPKLRKIALERWQQLAPFDATPDLAQIAYECSQTPLTEKSYSIVKTKIKDNPTPEDIAHSLRSIWQQRHCKALDQTKVKELINIMLSREATSYAERQQLLSLRGDIAITDGDLQTAARTYRESWQTRRDLNLLNIQALKLSRAGYENAANWLLETFELSSKSNSIGKLHIYYLFYNPKHELERAATFITRKQS